MASAAALLGAAGVGADAFCDAGTNMGSLEAAAAGLACGFFAFEAAFGFCAGLGLGLGAGAGGASFCGGAISIWGIEIGPSAGPAFGAGPPSIPGSAGTPGLAGFADLAGFFGIAGIETGAPLGADPSPSFGNCPSSIS